MMDKILDDILLDRVNGEIEVIHTDIEGKYLGCEVTFRVKGLYPVRLITRYGVLKARNKRGETKVIEDKSLTLIIEKYDVFAKIIKENK